MIDDLLSRKTVPEQDKKILRHTQSVAAHGNYPSAQYYSTFYSPAEITYNSLAEIVEYNKKVIDFYNTSALQAATIRTINESNSFEELRSGLEKLLNEDTNYTEEISFESHSYGKSLETPYSQGLTTCVTEFDNLTNGLQPGTVSSVCAFTSHGKSTYMLSWMFKKYSSRKKGMFVIN